MYCYILFCLTSKCEPLVGKLESYLSCTVLYPQQVCCTRVNGKLTDVVSPILPGYIFLYSESKPLDTSRMMIDGVIRVLTGPDGDPILRGCDQVFAMTVLRANGKFGKAEVYEAGQEIRLVKGSFAGVPAKIHKVDRRNARMQIELMLFERPVRTWIGYEMAAAPQ